MVRRDVHRFSNPVQQWIWCRTYKSITYCYNEICERYVKICNSGGVTIINYIVNISDDGLKLHFCNDADLFVIKVCLLSMRLRSNIFLSIEVIKIRDKKETNRIQVQLVFVQ